MIHSITSSKCASGLVINLANCVMDTTAQAAVPGKVTLLQLQNMLRIQWHGIQTIDRRRGEIRTVSPALLRRVPLQWLPCQWHPALFGTFPPTWDLLSRKKWPWLMCQLCCCGSWMGRIKGTEEQGREVHTLRVTQCDAKTSPLRVMSH